MLSLYKSEDLNKVKIDQFVNKIESNF